MKASIYRGLPIVDYRRVPVFFMSKLAHGYPGYILDIMKRLKPTEIANRVLVNIRWPKPSIRESRGRCLNAMGPLQTFNSWANPRQSMWVCLKIVYP